ncbi:MAG: Tfp pilus assembly protein FimT/FimU [Gemmatimonadales bacterium]
MHMHKNLSGFTLIELAIVLAVSGILTSIAIIKVGPSLERARVRRSANLIVADLQYAQMIAARQGKPVVIITSEPLKSYIIRNAADTTIFRERYFGDDTPFELKKLKADPKNFLVFPNGVVKKNSKFKVEVNKYKWEVKLTRAGQIRLKKKN